MCWRIHFTFIIYKQFVFCRFRASAYTKVDRLCAVFLYNIIYDTSETSRPMKLSGSGFQKLESGTSLFLITVVIVLYMNMQTV